MDDVVHFVVVVGGVDPGRLWGAIGCVAWPSKLTDPALATATGA